MENAAENKHGFKYENGKIVVTGVSNVDGFEEKSVDLCLKKNALHLKGDGFKIESMDVKSGILTMDGRLISLCYREKLEKIPLWKRIFK